MVAWYWVLVALSVGGVLGFTVSAMLVVSKRAEEGTEYERTTYGEAKSFATEDDMREHITGHRPNHDKEIRNDRQKY